MFVVIEGNGDTIIEQSLNNKPLPVCNIHLLFLLGPTHRIVIVPANCAIALTQSLAIGAVKAK